MNNLVNDFIAQDAKIAKEWGCSADCLDYCLEQGTNYYLNYCENRCGWTCPSPFKFNSGELGHMFATTPADVIEN